MVSDGRHSRNRDATHPVNAMLNYAYGILESQVRTQVVTAGLDPTIGYFHSSYRTAHRLVFELMEPMPPVVDRNVLEFVQQHLFEPRDFTLTREGVCRLNPELAKAIVKTTDADRGTFVAMNDVSRHLLVGPRWSRALASYQRLIGGLASRVKHSLPCPCFVIFDRYPGASVGSSAGLSNSAQRSYEIASLTAYS